jgi:signal transduction histidine kinase
MDQMRDEIDAMRELIEDMMLLARLEVEGCPEASRPDITEAVVDCLRTCRRRAGAGLRLAGHAAAGNLHRRSATAGGRDPGQPAGERDPARREAFRHRGHRPWRGGRGCRSPTPVRAPAEHLSRVFERFHRVEGSRAGPGTGPGARDRQHIAEAHGGRATAESRLGGGTTMRVVLPAPAGVTTR